MSERITFYQETVKQPENRFNAQILPRTLKHVLAEKLVQKELRAISNGVDIN